MCIMLFVGMPYRPVCLGNTIFSHRFVVLPKMKPVQRPFFFYFFFFFLHQPHYARRYCMCLHTYKMNNMTSERTNAGCTGYNTTTTTTYPTGVGI